MDTLVTIRDTISYIGGLIVGTVTLLGMILVVLYLAFQERIEKANAERQAQEKLMKEERERNDRR